MADQTDLTPMYEALQKAHAAGDTKSAQKLADYIRAEQAKPPQEALDPVPLHPAEMIADTVGGTDPGSWFSPKDPQEVSAKEAAGSVGGGAAAGALGGAVLPGALKVAGKIIPGPIGKAAGALGDITGALPLKERVIRGAGGGAAMGGVDSLGKALGAPTALNFAGDLLAGGLGESGASLLASTGDKLARFIANASYGNVAGASRALGGMFSPNKQLNEATALKLQKKLFGEKTEGYVEGLTGVDNRVAAQEAMRKADPSLMAGARLPAAVDGSGLDPLTGELTPMSGSTDLATVGGARPAAAAGPLGLPGAAAVADSNPLIAKPQGAAAGFTKEAAAAATAAANDPAAAAAMASGRAGAKAKLTAAQAAQQAVDDSAAAQALKPASQIYRERMYDGVTAAVKGGQPFSATPEFADFQDALQHQVTMGNVPPAKAAELLRQLRLDRAQGSGNGKVLESYAEQVDNNIRKWGKPAEGAVATGADAVDAGTAMAMRGALQDSFNRYTTRIGLGPVEQQYRNAYSTEMLAEAKDKLPKFLFGGLESGQEFAKMARNLARDPQGKELLQQAVGQHLANVEPKEIVGEFERLQSALVSSRLVEPQDLGVLRRNADAVKRTNDEGLKLRVAEGLKQRLLLAVTQRGGVAAGQAVGAVAGQQQEGQ